MYKFLLGFLIVSLPLLAQASQVVGFGGVAVGLMGSVDFFSRFIQAGCLFVGGCFVFASVIKYFEHRRSPLMVPISTVVFLFICGSALLLLPLLSYVLGYGSLIKK